MCCIAFHLLGVLSIVIALWAKPVVKVVSVYVMQVLLMLPARQEQ